MLSGGQVVKRTFTINEIPVYVKEGAIIPMQSKVKNLSEKPDRIILNVFPGIKGSASLYEDEGNNRNYLNNKYAVTKFEQERKGAKQYITIYPADGSFKGMEKQKTYEIRLINAFLPVQVKINGTIVKMSEVLKNTSWCYDGKELTAKILIPKAGVNRKDVVEVVFPDGEQNLVDGKKIKFNRLGTFVKYLAGKRNFWRQTNWNDGEHNSGLIVKASQTGYILSQTKQNFFNELKSFDKNWIDILNILKEVSGSNSIFATYYNLLNVLE
jgi:hypothetical protein